MSSAPEPFNRITMSWLGVQHHARWRNGACTGRERGENSEITLFATQ
jgi:hypothetical protein